MQQQNYPIQNPGLINQPEKYRLFGCLTPVRTCCCGCKLHSAIITLAVFQCLYGFMRILTLFTLEQRLASAIIDLCLCILLFLSAYYGFVSHKKQIFTQRCLFFNKILYFIHLAFLLIIIFAALIYEEYLFMKIQNEDNNNYLQNVRNDNMEEQNVNFEIIFLICCFMINLILYGYFLLIIHSYLVFEYICKQNYSDSQQQFPQMHQQNFGQPVYMINQPVVMPYNQPVTVPIQIAQPQIFNNLNQIAIGQPVQEYKEK